MRNPRFSKVFLWHGKYKTCYNLLFFLNFYNFYILTFRIKKILNLKQQVPNFQFIIESLMRMLKRIKDVFRNVIGIRLMLPVSTGLLKSLQLLSVSFSLVPFFSLFISLSVLHRFCSFRRLSAQAKRYPRVLVKAKVAGGGDRGEIW